MKTVPVTPPACANWTHESPVCPSKAPGSLLCGNCKLVLYCGAKCQKAHWPEHRKVCKSPLSKDKWRPEWDRENRSPAWMSGQAATNIHNPYGAEKYLWGNVPALDILNLVENEGAEYAQDVSLLFAASGDLRNVVKTVAGLPKEFKSRLHITINDREFEVVARNVILLLFAFVSLEDTSPSSIPDIAASLLHIWYSAFLPTNLLSSLKAKVQPLIGAVCAQMVTKSPDTLLGKNWTFLEGSTLRLVLQQKEWLRLHQFLDMPKGLTLEKARSLRAATVLAPERLDYRERWYYKDATPSMRLAKQRFREDGLLLPFGHPRTGFDVPNPTIFQTPNSWPFDDKADPLSGWPIADVVAAAAPAPNDWYGKLFVYSQDAICKFLRRFIDVKVDLQLLNIDARYLPDHLDRDTFARIEVSNITDRHYLGTHQTLKLLSPLLQSPTKNPHATLISLYLNALIEVMKSSGEKDQALNIELMLKYVTIKIENMLKSQQGADYYKLWDSRHFGLSAEEKEEYFQTFMAKEKFKQLEKKASVTMKGKPTVIEPWPTALKLRPGQDGAQAEFDLLLASSFTGLERYVEWKRIA